MKRRKNFFMVIIFFSLLIIFFLLYSQSQKELFLQEGKFLEWLQFNSNGILVIIGAFATVISVIIAVEYSKGVERKEKLRKVSLLIYSEFKEYIFSAENCLNLYIDNLITEYYGGSSFMFVDELREDIKDIEKPYKINYDIKSMIYELILMSDSKDRYKAYAVLNFYRYYKSQIDEWENDNYKKFRFISPIFIKEYFNIFKSGETTIERYDDDGTYLGDVYIGISKEIGSKIIEFRNNNDKFELNKEVKIALKYLLENIGVNNSDNL